MRPFSFLKPANSGQVNGKIGVVEIGDAAENWPAIMNDASNSLLENGNQSHCELCPLTRIQAGIAVRVRQLCMAPETQHRLREMGMGEDQIVRLIANRTNFICQVCNTRLALSEQLARLIMVEPVQQPASARYH